MVNIWILLTILYNLGAIFLWRKTCEKLEKLRVEMVCLKRGHELYKDEVINMRCRFNENLLIPIQKAEKSILVHKEMTERALKDMAQKIEKRPMKKKGTKKEKE